MWPFDGIHCLTKKASAGLGIFFFPFLCMWYVMCMHKYDVCVGPHIPQHICRGHRAPQISVLAFYLVGGTCAHARRPPPTHTHTLLFATVFNGLSGLWDLGLSGHLPSHHRKNEFAEACHHTLLHVTFLRIQSQVIMFVWQVLYPQSPALEYCFQKNDPMFGTKENGNWKYFRQMCQV